MKITFITHSTCLLEIKGEYLLVDPFISSNSFFNKNYSFEKYVKSLKKLDYILITHAHYDHVSDVEFFYKKFNNILLISNYEISNYFNKRGVKTNGINYGSFIPFSFGRLKYTWAIHSSVFNDGTYGGNPGGFLIHTKEGNIYISGDTAVTNEMKIIPKFGKLNISILPIGGKYTMDIEEAIIASNLLKCEKILGVHYDTFSDIEIDKDEAINKFKENGKKLFLLKFGESLLI
ncbi:metal-dependent hydrolase [Blattabacterium cuenoti]|uniref:metal-dependent hydrolase n=1 Tax=Blattabacterium cuenoti TaxID=1653831 RepID=UPI00163C3BE4|nr:metal-dependent hydrolase [Blattabacterium cuenoti]